MRQFESKYKEICGCSLNEDRNSDLKLVKTMQDIIYEALKKEFKNNDKVLEVRMSKGSETVQVVTDSSYINYGPDILDKKKQ